MEFKSLYTDYLWYLRVGTEKGRRKYSWRQVCLVFQYSVGWEPKYLGLVIVVFLIIHLPQQHFAFVCLCVCLEWPQCCFQPFPLLCHLLSISRGSKSWAVSSQRSVRCLCPSLCCVQNTNQAHLKTVYKGSVNTRCFFSFFILSFKHAGKIHSF